MYSRDAFLPETRAQNIATLLHLAPRRQHSARIDHEPRKSSTSSIKSLFSMRSSRKHTIAGPRSSPSPPNEDGNMPMRSLGIMARARSSCRCCVSNSRRSLSFSLRRVESIITGEANVNVRSRKTFQCVCGTPASLPPLAPAPEPPASFARGVRLRREAVAASTRRPGRYPLSSSTALITSSFFLHPLRSSKGIAMVMDFFVSLTRTCDGAAGR